jgi:small GTP-binding protein
MAIQLTTLKKYSFKLVLLGEASVGKSSIAIQAIKREFSTYQEATIGASYFTHTVPLTDCNVKFEIWDTAGQERYHCLAPMYYRGATVAIIVYDVTCKSSYGAAQRWIKELKQQGNSNTIIMLVGNKMDLNSERQVDMDEVKQYAEDHKFLFIETSAKNNYNIQEMFKQLAEIIPKKDINAKMDTIVKPELPIKKSHYCCGT